MHFYYLGIIITLAVTGEAVYNGTFISIKEAPYYVSLTLISPYSFCGGTILSEYWIVTAAHCVNLAPKYFTIRTGSTGQYLTAKVIVHGDYEKTKRIPAHNDIALVKLFTPIEFNEFQQPIKIRSVPPAIGDKIIITGFGSQGAGHSVPPVLKTLKQTVMEGSNCNPFFGISVYNSNIFCAGGYGMWSCSGDSGGPAVIDNELVGIVSYGPTVCDPITPSRMANAYTFVHYYKDWISYHTGLKF